MFHPRVGPLQNPGWVLVVAWTQPGPDRGHSPPLGMGRRGSGRFRNRPSKPQPDPTNTPPRRLRLPYRRLLPGSLPITPPSHRPLRPRPLHPRTRLPPRRSPQHPNPTRPQFPDRTGISPEPGYRTQTDGSGHRHRTPGHRPQTARSRPHSPTQTARRPTRPPRHPPPDHPRRQHQPGTDRKPAPMTGLGPRHVTAEQFAAYLEKTPPPAPRCRQQPGRDGAHSPCPG